MSRAMLLVCLGHVGLQPIENELSAGSDNFRHPYRRLSALVELPQRAHDEFQIVAYGESAAVLAKPFAQTPRLAFSHPSQECVLDGLGSGMLDSLGIGAEGSDAVEGTGYGLGGHYRLIGAEESSGEGIDVCVAELMCKNSYLDGGERLENKYESKR